MEESQESEQSLEESEEKLHAVESDQSQNPDGEKEGTTQGVGKILSDKEMAVQDAEKLLRSIEDKIGRYHIRRKDIEERSSNGNGW